MANASIKRLLAPPDYKPNPRKWVFWRDSFIYFWVFSLIGHLFEFPWISLMNAIGQNLPYPPLVAIAIPYGFGVLGILWFVYPILKKKNWGPVMAFILSAVVCTAIEFVCALVIYLIYGHNVFWDYSHDFANLFGFICLKNSLAFGAVALLFIYVLFPLMDRLMTKLGQIKLNIIFWILFGGYILIHLFALILTGDVNGQIIQL